MTIHVRVPLAEDFESAFRNPGFGYYDRGRPATVGPMPSYETLLEGWLQAATLDNARRWSRVEHRNGEAQLSLFTDDCGHPNPESDPKYDGVEFFQRRVSSARFPWSWKTGRSESDPYVVAFMEAAAAGHPLVAEFEAAMEEWDEHHGLICDLSPAGTICRPCAEAHDEWDDDGMEPSGCRLHDDVVEAYGDFWYANGEGRGES